jgi:hypothetical protein
MLSALLVFFAFIVLGAGFVMIVKPSLATQLLGIQWRRSRLGMATFGSVFAILLLSIIVAPSLPEAVVDPQAQVVNSVDSNRWEDSSVEIPAEDEDVDSVQVIELKTNFPIAEEQAANKAPAITLEPDATAPSTPEPVASGTVHSPSPEPTPTYICSSNYYNCTTHAQGQAIFDYCMGQVGYDVHDLDRDNDGDACESSP